MKRRRPNVQPSCRRPRALQTAGVVALTLVWLLLLPTRGLSADRVSRIYDERDGLTVSQISLLAQDDRGFLWIGTEGGLFRFDGRSVRAWPPSHPSRRAVSNLSTGPPDKVLVGGNDGRLQWVVPTGFEPVIGPGGEPITGVVHATLGSDGRLWVLDPDSLHWQGGSGDWRSIPSTSFGEGELFRIRPAGKRDAFVSTSESLWRISPDGVLHEIARIGGVNLVEEMSDGRLACLTRWTGDLYEIQDSEVRLLVDGTVHGRGLAIREDQIWASIDQFIYVVRPGEAPEAIAPSAHHPTGQALLVDQEGSLWIGSYQGLVQFPEPETITYDGDDGLPVPTHARFVAVTDDAVWLSTWYGLGRLDLREPYRRGHVEIPDHWGRVCIDGRDRLWTAGKSGFYIHAGSEFKLVAQPGVWLIYDSATRPDGTLWLATRDGLYLTTLDGTRPRRPAASPPADWGSSWESIRIKAVLEDRRGSLWVAGESEICRAPAESVAGNVRTRWSCSSFGESVELTDLVELPSGTIWASTTSEGIFRCDEGEWSPIPGSLELPSPNVETMEASPSGGAWILGAGNTFRVIERPDLPEGWEIVERLTIWQGMPNQSAHHLCETEDGRVWVASWAGVTELPPRVRSAQKEPPRVELVDLLLDGQSLFPVDDIRLPYKRNRLELHFAALSYRDRNLVRYQFRLRPDDPWSASGEPILRFVDLPPGHYAAEIRASLDGKRWSETPARLAFLIGRPWYQQTWAILLAFVAVSVILYTIYRLRLAFLLRLERQRTRIAMDLHDEMGSGLGSIGILSGLATDPDLPESTRRDLAARIADAAGDLGTALTDIVWSLRPGSDTLEALAYHLAERGGRLFPERDVAFHTRFPEPFPRIRLGVDIARNIQLIALEAMHNAARHSGGSEVTLAIDEQGGQWRLTVSDDGKGFNPDRINCEVSGDGIDNMKRRAAQVGAGVSWHSIPGGGTRVGLLFQPRGGRRSHHRARDSRE